VSGAKGTGEDASVCVRARTRSHASWRRDEAASEDEEGRGPDEEQRTERTHGEVLLRFAKNAGPRYNIYLQKSARAPRAIRRHVDARARWLSADDMNLIYKL